MCDYSESKLTQLMAKSMRQGVNDGFDQIDIQSKHMASVFPGRFYNLFSRHLKDN